MQISLRLGLLHDDHGVSLPEEGPGGTKLSELNQFNDNLEKKSSVATIFYLKVSWNAYLNFGLNLKQIRTDYFFTFLVSSYLFN